MTQIIVTMWPAIDNEEKLTELYENGVRILRFNFPHYNQETVVKSIKIIRRVEKKVWWKFQLLIDTEWPEIRTWFLSNPIDYSVWENFKIFVDEGKRDEKSLFCDYPSLVQDVQVGWIVKIDAGLLEAEILEKWDNYILVKALNNFTVWSRRHINLPGIHYNLPGITSRDKENVLFAIEQWFDFIALSFTRNADDVKELREILKQNKGSQTCLPVGEVKIISKIENQEWVDNIDKIIDSSDIIMVARGDLGTELPVETIPMHQMNIVKKCKIKNTPIVVATQMLESMINAPIPTRAEVSDVFYAVLEWADYVMLSWETAIGKYPIDCVKVMNKVIQQAERN